MPSCAFDGIDRIFSYPGADIHTYPRDEQDFVHTIHLKDDSLSIHGGIRLGSDIAEVISAYGNGYEESLGLYTYRKGDTYLSFMTDESGMVILISYGLVMG
jgi:hypothetical protein